MIKNTRLIVLAVLMIPLLVHSREKISIKEDMETLRKYQLTLTSSGKGLDLVSQGEYDSAERRFDDCLRILPGQPYACFGKAIVYKRRAELAVALTWIEKAERGLLNLQRIWVNQKTSRINMSPEEKRRMNAIASQGFDYRQNSVFCTSKQLLVKNRTARSATGQFRGMKSEPSPFDIPAEFFSIHGDILFKLKKFDQAEAQYLKALDADPRHQRCLNNLINIYYIKRRLDRAGEWLKKAAERGVKVNRKLKQAVLSSD